MFNRRHFLAKTGAGFGALAAASLLHAGAKPPHFPTKIKTVIYLFMHGGVSHIDTWDPKPEFTKRSGQTERHKPMLIGEAAQSEPVGGEVLASKAGQFFASAEAISQQQLSAVILDTELQL